MERDFIGHGGRPRRLALPGDIRVAVSVVLNYEVGGEYSLLDGDDVDDAWGEGIAACRPTVRDLGTESDFEYGSRVGIWRLARIFDRAAVPITIDACAQSLERNPQVAAWIRRQSHEVLGHGWRWTEVSRVSRDVEAELMDRAIASVLAMTGQRVEGWLARSFPSIHTRDLILERGGFIYDSNPANDELPYTVTEPSGDIAVVPFSKVYTDVKYFAEPFYRRPDDFYDVLKSGLDQLLQETGQAGSSSVMTVALHARWSGQACRSAVVRRFVDYVAAQRGAAFMKRIDICRAAFDSRTLAMSR